MSCAKSSRTRSPSFAHRSTTRRQKSSLQEDLIAAREAALSGNGCEVELHRQHEAMLEAEREKRVQHLARSA